MPTYVVLVDWTEHGVKNVKQTTLGAHDMVAVFEAPDDEAISAHALEPGSWGNIRTTTLRAYNEEEMSGILQRLG